MGIPRVFFLALCRDCARTIHHIVVGIERLRKTGKYETFLIAGENASTDGSRALLENYAACFPWLLVVDTGFMTDIPNRLARMAAGREELKLHLPPLADGDLIVVIDVDLVVVKGFDETDFSAAIDELGSPGVFGVCSSSVPEFYDLLALEDDCGGQNPAQRLHLLGTRERSLMQKLLGYRKKLGLQSDRRRYQKALGTGAGRKFPSSFNGLCMYDRSRYDRVGYVGDGDKCEHIHLHEALRRTWGGGVYVSPHLVVQAPQEHLDGPSLMRDIGRHIKTLFSRVSG